LFIRLFLLLTLGYLISFLYRKLWKNNNFVNDNKTNNINEPEEMKQDPVCKTYVPKSQAINYKTNNKTLYFCSEECKNKYIDENK
jgi:YHS domain-containing protein